MSATGQKGVKGEQKQAHLSREHTALQRPGSGMSQTRTETPAEHIHIAGPKSEKWQTYW
jgi:hypothetical protein